jgi:hypothetical protein
MAIIVTTWLVLMRLGLDCSCPLEFWLVPVLSCLPGEAPDFTSTGDVKFVPQNPQYLAPFRIGWLQFGQVVDMGYSYLL